METKNNFLHKRKYKICPCSESRNIFYLYIEKYKKNDKYFHQQKNAEKHKHFSAVRTCGLPQIEPDLMYNMTVNIHYHHHHQHQIIITIISGEAWGARGVQLQSRPLLHGLHHQMVPWAWKRDRGKGKITYTPQPPPPPPYFFSWNLWLNCQLR